MDDSRLQEIRQWCARVLGNDDFRLTVASADASFRRYFRLHRTRETCIVMDAPPDACGSQEGFVAVAGLLRDAGVHAPEVRAEDRARGFVLMEDLGERTYLDAINADDSDALFTDAIDTLIRIQRIDPGSAVPEYDRESLRAELELFPDWYVARHQGVSLATTQRQTLEECFTMLEDAALAQSRVFVHRDFMPRNLIISEPNPGVIDFQDAVRGPVTYDLLSLLRDAFLTWPGESVAGWMRQYWDKARHAGIPVPVRFDDFQRDFDWMGVQRHLKVIGIFARLCYRDGKPGYLADTPRFFRYIRDTVRRYDELAPLGALLGDLDSARASERPPVLEDREAPAS